MAFIDLTGQRFHRLTVVAYDHSKKYVAYWKCRCECGNVLIVRGCSLKTGNTKSCGCQKIDSATKHGHSHSRPGKPPSTTYNSWQSMNARCKAPESQHYWRYGAKGIKVCDRWQSFENFLEDMGERPENTTLDRINPEGDYEPGNCRWASPKQQANNRTNNRLLSLNGEQRSVGAWAEVYGIPRTVIQDRLRLGWDDKKAITTPYTPRQSKNVRPKSI